MELLPYLLIYTHYLAMGKSIMITLQKHTKLKQTFYQKHLLVQMN